MTEAQEDFNSTSQEPPTQLSAEEIHARRFQPRSFGNTNSQKKTPLREQISKPPKNSVKIRPAVIPVHFQWSLILTIFCFFLIAPCWALYKTVQLRRMIKQQESEAALQLSHKITTVLLFSTVLGIIVWVAILFCSVGLVITGKLLDSRAI